ncbi:hypothetical protein PVAP13_8KG100072 [Panicum virgatum]|uniref:Uncharacterized protein n=1 Tax=Panicum virgatum TaxID=38727 RepID=A0A8T0PK34_PANVG|nr:hypothetical protein PVAP13_8KG100072 [Panicum virgatum]
MPPLVGSPPPHPIVDGTREGHFLARFMTPLAGSPPPTCPTTAAAPRPRCRFSTQSPAPRHGKELAPAGALASPLALGGLGSTARTISSCLRPPWHAAGAAPACSRLLIGVAWGHTPARTWPPAASPAGRGRHPRYTAAFHSGIPGLHRLNPWIFPICISFIPCTSGACIIVETISLDFDQSCL